MPLMRALPRQTMFVPRIHTDISLDTQPFAHARYHGAAMRAKTRCRDATLITAMLLFSAVTEPPVHYSAPLLSPYFMRQPVYFRH